MEKEHSIVRFNQQKVRCHWDENCGEWFFSIIDVIAVLTDSSNPRRYWSDLKTRQDRRGVKRTIKSYS